MHRVVIAVTDRDQRGLGGSQRRRVKRSDVIDGQERERPLAAERRVSVRMAAIQQPDECAICDGAGHVAKLCQPIQPKLAYAHEVAFQQGRAGGDVGEQRQRGPDEPAKRRHR